MYVHVRLSLLSLYTIHVNTMVFVCSLFLLVLLFKAKTSYMYVTAHRIIPISIIVTNILLHSTYGSRKSSIKLNHNYYKTTYVVYLVKLHDIDSPVYTH